MIVYRSQARSEGVRAVLNGLRGRGARDLLIGFGELESGIADALCPERDTVNPTLRVLRGASEDIGRAMFTGEGEFPRALDAVGRLVLPERVRITVPEGYAYYALYPEAYIEAARRFHERERPERATAIGIRSIGTSLSGAVAGTLSALGCETRSYTVRPRGHPFDRRIAASPELDAELCARRDSWFAVVDEGPGLSGSSFACVALWLSGLGIPSERIVLFPSWQPDGSGFVSRAACEQWCEHRKHTVPFEEAWRPPWPGAIDVSAGGWRSLLFRSEAEYPAANPQHERRKYLWRDRGILLKFAGLGDYGTERLGLAHELAEGGFGPAVEGLYDGFLATRFERGRPLAAADAGAALIKTMARYFAFRERTFAAPPGASFDELFEMVRVNAREGLGEASERAADRLETFRSPVTAAGAAAIDGRMLPHEWLETERGYIKTDSVDHHDDHFFPGNQNIAWDIAAAEIEFRLPRSAQQRLIAGYLRGGGDPDLPVRLPFYQCAYAAFRLGYATTSARGLVESPDGMRFHQIAGWYADRLRGALSALA